GWDSRNLIIPVFDNKDCVNFRLRSDPTYPNSKSALYSIPGRGRHRLFNTEVLKTKPKDVIICEGEWDCMLLDQLGYNAVTSTGGCASFKNDWIPYFKEAEKVSICFDNDKGKNWDNPGQDNSVKLVEEFKKQGINAVNVKLPDPDVNSDKVDITDYFIKLGKTKEEFGKLLDQTNIVKRIIEGIKKEKLEKYQAIQPQNNREMGVYAPQNWPEIDKKDLINVLGVTIKKDDVIKQITFLSGILTYTEQDQINLMFNSPSSSGKSYIALETISLFPQEDVYQVGYASPTAFWYSYSKYDEERDLKIVDLERKIIVFLDMPYFELLEKIRSLLSKDEKEIFIRVTNRSKRGENRADNICVRGFPTVIFASASFQLDEQELTRFILLSPQTDKEKIDLAVEEAALKVSNYSKYLEKINSIPERQDLIHRIIDIKNSGIKEIIIPDHNLLLEMFRARYEDTKPRHARDIKRVAALAKGYALLNLWTRKRVGDDIEVKNEDLQNAFALWDEIYIPQELGLPPFVYEVYEKVIWTTFKNKGSGLERKDIQKKFIQVYHNQLPDWKLRKEYISMLNASGIIYEEDHPTDKRIQLIFPVLDPQDKKAIKRVRIHPQFPISPEAESVSKDINKKANNENTELSKYATKDNNFLIAESIRLRQKLAKSPEDKQIQLELEELVTEGQRRKIPNEMTGILEDASYSEGLDPENELSF
ncbi:hypothetical protein A3J15_03145, partial [Candidatus Roizmanbacteria bacterium RIFCSPLOWO2_02_FULL_38_10]